MPAKKINTRKNYKLLGGTKMRGGSDEFLEYDSNLKEIMIQKNEIMKIKK